MKLADYPPQEPLSGAGAAYSAECWKRGEGIAGEDTARTRISACCCSNRHGRTGACYCFGTVAVGRRDIRSGWASWPRHS